MIPQNQKTRIKELLRLEKRHKKELAAAIFVLLLTYNSEHSFLYISAPLTALIAESLSKIHKDASKLAEKHANPPEPAERDSKAERLRQVALTAAAMSLAAQVMRGVQTRLLAGKEYDPAVREAMKLQAWQVDRTAVTETYNSYNTSFVQSLKNQSGMFEWNAVLDKRTCSTCEDRDGKRYRADAIPTIPNHSNCRCFLLFIPE